MMKRTVTYHPKVPSEARDFLDYYQNVSTGLADDFWGELIGEKHLFTHKVSEISANSFSEISQNQSNQW